MPTDPRTFANLTAEQALSILQQQCNLSQFAPKLGDVEVAAVSIGGGKRPEAEIKVEDYANDCETFLNVPAEFAKRLLEDDEDARHQLERVMRAEGN